MISVSKKILGIITPKEKRRLGWLLALILVASFFEALSIGSLQPFLALVARSDVIETNAILSHLYYWFGFSGHQSFLIFIGLATLSIILVTNALAAVSVWIQLRFAWNVNHSLSLRLMRSYLARPYGYFLRHNSSELNKYILQESQRLILGTVIPGLDLVANMVKMLAIVGLLLFIEPVVTVYSITVFGGVYALLYLKVRNRLKLAGVKVLEANKNRHQVSAEAFGGIKEVKVFGRESFFLNRFKPQSRAYSHYHATNQIYQKLPRYLFQGLAFGGLTLLLVYLLVRGQDLARIAPVMGMFIFAALRLLPALQLMIAALTKFRFNDKLLEEIYCHLALDDSRHSDPTFHTTEIQALPFERDIRLVDVSFQYPDMQRPVLKNLTISVSKNASIAFVGQTGAGKTTLIDILLGLHTPQSGTMCVDGVAICEENQLSWRKNIGYVPQEIFLCDDTIYANIAFGIPQDAINRSDVEKAARVAHLHDFIVSELPAGYETVVGERGIRLSGGQRQRIGIARALYHNPSVLVLDEATSDIDGVTEANITRAIDELAGEKTLIIIAHRLQTIRNCDRIYVLSNGRIVAKGTFEDLRATNAQFHALAEHVPMIRSVCL